MTTSAFDGPLGPTLFKVVSGTPSAAELAAVTVLLTALTSAAQTATEAGDGSTLASDTANWNRPVSFPPVSWMAAGRAVGN